MQNDGEIDYSRHSGRQLLEVYESIDRRNFPKNFAAAVAEWKTRPAPGQVHLDGGEVKDLGALPAVSRAPIFRACTAQVLWLTLGQLLSVVVAAALVGVLYWLLSKLVGELGAKVVAGLAGLGALLTIQVGSYWIYTKWLPGHNFGSFAFRLIQRTGNGT